MSPTLRPPDRPDAATLAEWADRYGHVAAVVLLAAFVFWTRVRGWHRFVSDGEVLFRGNDAWYHYRQVTYAVEHFPGTMPFDPWTAYPRGIAVGQFGTPFDQTVALAALVVGLGDPGEQTVALTLLFAPAVLGTLVVVPTYLLGRHYAGRTGGVVAVTVLALSPGGFLQRSLVGFADHHVAETLLQATAMLAVLSAVRAAQCHDEELRVFRARAVSGLRNQPFVDPRGVDGATVEAVRRPLATAVLAGVALAAYVLVWPPGAVLGLVLATFFAVHLSVVVVRGRDPEPVAFVGVVTVLSAAVVTCAGVSTADFDPIAVSLLQPALFGLLAVGLVGLVALARAFESASLPRRAYPVAVAGCGVGLTAVVRLLAPARFDFFASYLLRVFGYTLSPSSGSVSETRRVAFDSVLPFLELSYGLAFGLALVGIVAATVGYLRSETTDGSTPALVVWLAFLTIATLTQIRFDYYLVVPVAVASGVAVAWAVDRAGLTRPSDLTDLRMGRLVAVAVVGLLVVGPFVSSVGAAGVTMEATETSADWGPDEVTEWQDSLAWLRGNTPEQGRYGDPDGEAFPRYPTVSPTDDYDYPPGTYGVLSWWDAGHFVATLGRRVPVANPFQEGRVTAADFFLAREESRANERVTWSDERVQYVLVDWALAVPGVGKYASPIANTNRTRRLGDLVRPVYRSSGRSRQFAGYAKRQAHYESLRVRLFRYHGSAKSPQPVVTDWETRPLETADGRRTESAVVRADSAFVRRFDTLATAREFVRDDGSAQVGGVDGLPAERVPALEHYRLVHVSDARYAASTIVGRRTGPSVKTFERVPGATVRGQALPNATVTASVRLVPESGAAFTYTQRVRAGADGTFSLTLPYSTTGYDDYGPAEGYTNVSVRASGPYTVTARRNGTVVGSTPVHVPEGAVVGAEPAPDSIRLGSS